MFDVHSCSRVPLNALVGIIGGFQFEVVSLVSKIGISNIALASELQAR